MELGRFNTAFEKFRQLSLSWAGSIQAMPPLPFLDDPRTYAKAFHVASFPPVHHKNSVSTKRFPHACYMLHLILLHPDDIWYRS
jgi:hypothetical protein